MATQWKRNMWWFDNNQTDQWESGQGNDNQGQRTDQKNRKLPHKAPPGMEKSKRVHLVLSEIYNT